jgi:hypothetical protein
MTEAEMWRPSRPIFIRSKRPFAKVRTRHGELGYASHTVLTDNGIAFVDLPKNRNRYPEISVIFGGHIFDRVCREHGILHKPTRPYHPLTNGQLSG